MKIRKRGHGAAKIKKTAGLSREAFLPVSRADMDVRGWDELDVLIITGDAYVDHPSFGHAIIARWLEAHGFRIGIISQPDWRGTADFLRMGRADKSVFVFFS